VLLRFRNEDTKNKSKLERAILWFFRGVRAEVLLVSIWLVFDPTFGPRQLLARQMNLSLPLLTFDYLNALGIGFLAGNLMLIFQPRHKLRRRRKFGQNVVVWLERAAVPAMTTLLVLVVLGLGARNLPGITLANRQPLTQFGELMLRSLPPGGGIVVSDFPDKLAVLQAALAQHPDQSDWLPVDIKALPEPEYRARWEHLHGRHWLASTNTHKLAPGEMISVMDQLAQSNRVFYIHPSFGYFFEFYYQQPAGLAFELKHFPTDTLTPPLVTKETIAQNEQVWDELAPEIESLQRLDETASPSLAKSVEEYFFLESKEVSQHALST